MMSSNHPITDWSTQRVWLIGASSGIGAALAQQLHARGAHVALSARRVNSLEQQVAALGSARACALPLDVTDAPSVARAEQALVARWGAYDLVVLLAGDYLPQSVTAFELERARQIVETNLTGVYNTLAVVLPRLLAAGHGGLALVSSVAGYRGLPRSLVYGPTKAALNNLAEALYLELHGRGLNVYLINPGFVRTPLTAANPFPMPALMDAPDAALAILTGFAHGRFEIHFPRRFTLVMKCLALLPHALYLPLVRWLTR